MTPTGRLCEDKVCISGSEVRRAAPFIARVQSNKICHVGRSRATGTLAHVAMHMARGQVILRLFVGLFCDRVSMSICGATSPQHAAFMLLLLMSVIVGFHGLLYHCAAIMFAHSWVPCSVSNCLVCLHLHKHVPYPSSMAVRYPQM